MTAVCEREPLRMSPLPSEPWKEVAIDFWGPSAQAKPRSRHLQTLTVGRSRVCQQNQRLSSNTKVGPYILIAWNTSERGQRQWASIQCTELPGLWQVPGL